MKKSFLLYLDQNEVVNALTNEQAGRLFKSIFKYHSGSEPELDPLLKLVFIPFKQTFIRDANKWEVVRKRNAENGKKGGRPKNIKPKITQVNPENPVGILVTQSNPENLDSVSDSDNVSVNNTNTANKINKSSSLISRIDSQPKPTPEDYFQAAVKASEGKHG